MELEAFVESEDDDIVMFGIMFIAIACKIKDSNKKKKKFNRRWSVRPINRLRSNHGQYHSLFLNMKENDPEQFFKYTRMSVPIFNLLLSLIEPKLRKRNMTTVLTPEHRLAMTLLYLTQGCSMQVVAWSYFVGKSTVSLVIKEVCSAIWEVLSCEYLKQPNEEDFQKIALEFNSKWQFPNCIGALDGKHINIQAPKKSGSQFFNYKKTFSIVLMATCDADYNFVLVDIGAFGSQSDGGTFRNSTFGMALENGQIIIPGVKNLPNTNIEMPHFFVGDEAFPLKPYIMRPYPGTSLDAGRRIYNYRLSRARRIIENTFGILALRWRIFRCNIIAEITTVELIVASTICLHNFIRREEIRHNNIQYCPNNFVDHDREGHIILGEWRNDIEGNRLRRLGRIGANYNRRETNEIRNTLKDYLVSAEGAVPWQLNHINRTL